MAASLGQEKTRAHVEMLSQSVRDYEKRLSSAQRWPWKRAEVQKLQYELAQTLVVLGINQCVLEQASKAREAFVRAVSIAGERFAGSDRLYLGYHDVQVMAAGAVAGSWAATEAAAVNALRVSGGNRREDIVNTGSRAILGWMCRDSVVVKDVKQIADDGALRQFALWIEIATAAMNKDKSALESSFGALTEMVANEVKRGDFKYSEDRLAYLPGQLIVLLAQRDGMLLDVPEQEWWRLCF